MATAQTTELVLGQAGTGKTFYLVERLVNEIVPYEVGPIITNLPVDVEAIVERCWRGFLKHHKSQLKTEERAKQAIRQRFLLIPREVCKEWMREQSHLLDWIPADIAGGTLIIDEIHNFAGKRHKPDTLKLWQEFCGELRHRRARIIFATQEEHKLAIDVMREAGAQVLLSPIEEERCIGVRFGDYFQLGAKFFTGKVAGGFLECSKRREAGRWIENHRRYHWFRDEIFKLYNSYNAPISDDAEEVAAHDQQLDLKLRERALWETLGKWSLVKWFWGRNWWPLSKRLALVAVMLFVFLGPGGRWVLEGYQGFWATLAKNQIAAKQQKAKALSTPVQPVAPGQPLQASEEWRAAEAALRAEVEAKAGELKQIEERLEWLSAVVLISNDSATFRNGLTFKMGEQINDGGKWDGEFVVGVDPRTRIVRLSSGRVLRAGAGGKGCKCGQKDPAVSGPVPSGEPLKAGVGPAPATRTAPNAGGGRDGAKPVRSVPLKQNGGVDRGSGGVGYAAPQPIGKRAAAVGSTGGRRPTSVSASQQSGSGVLPGGSPARGQGGFVPSRVPINGDAGP